MFRALLPMEEADLIEETGLASSLPIKEESYDGYPRAGDRAVVISIAIAVVAYLGFIVHGSFRFEGKTYFTLADDAMVSMRYAYNLAHGHGLVWNPGAVPVEGYTNFLWALWMAVIHLLPLPLGEMPLVVALSGVPLIVGTAFATRWVVRLLAPGRPRAAFFGLVFTLFAYPLVYWTLRGMEVGLLALVLTVGTGLVLSMGRDVRNRPVALLAVLIVLGILTRTDFAPAAVVLAAFAVVRSPAERRVRVAVVLGGAILATVVGHTAFRMALYGSAVPNTYALKMAGFPLGVRIARGLVVGAVTLGAFLLVPLVFAGSHVLRERRVTSGPALILTLVSVQLLYCVYVGGDVWEWLGLADRFVTPVLPILLALATLGIDDLQAPRRSPRGDARRTRVALAGLGLALLTAAIPPGRLQGGVLLKVALVTSILTCLILVVASGLSVIRTRAGRMGATPLAALAPALVLGSFAVVAIFQLSSWVDYVRWDAARARWGLEVRKATAPDAVIAVASAGNIVYFADRSAVDLLGKSDPVIAHEAPRPGAFLPGHNKWDYDYSIGILAPDLVADPLRVNSAYAEALERAGFVEVLSPVYVRSDSTSVDRDAVRQVLSEWDGACPWQGVAPCRRVAVRPAS